MGLNLSILREEERPFGAIAHLATAVPIWGLVFNVGLWLYFRQRSREMIFHLQQAMFFHGVLMIVAIAWVGLQTVGWVIHYLAPRLGDAVLNTNLFILMLAYTAYVGVCVWGALQSYLGNGFFYPLIGRRLHEGSLRKTQVEEA